MSKSAKSALAELFAAGKAAQAKSQAAFLSALTTMQTVTVADMKNTGFTVK